MSTREERAQVMAALLALWEAYPDWRIGQLVANVAMMARGVEPGAVWEMSSQEVVEAVERHLARRRG
ncbi:MAG: hypothetical protein H6739_37060 [Alphaproteobacteria bacterium]|nr:hypothetical protein [Alphaproteobacteria bacterium]